MKPKLKKKCRICGREFTTKSERIVNCSRKCSREYKNTYDKEYQKEYQKSDKYKEYRKSDKYKEYQKEYHQNKRQELIDLRKEVEELRKLKKSNERGR